MLKRLRRAGSGLVGAVAHLSARRELQTTRVREAVSKRGVARIERDLQRLVLSKRDWPQQAEQPIAATAKRIVKRAWGEFADACEAADEARSLASWHEVRIHGKRLRYTLDGLKHLLGDEAEPALQVLIELQDELGAYLDSRVALEQLKDLQDFAGLGDEAGHAMESVMADLRAEGKAALAAVPSLLQQVRDWGPELARKAGKGRQ
jgi:CHAD domain-containing protein